MKPQQLDWWLIIRRGGVAHCWVVGDTDDQARTRDIIDRARVLVGFPAGDGWIADEIRRDSVQLTLGEPHPQLLADATRHQLSELDAVDAQALAAYRAACEVEHRRDCVRVAREAVSRLTTEERAQLYGEIPPRGTEAGTTRGGM